MSKSVEGSYKVRGLTSGSATIGTVDITLCNDGSVIFTDGTVVKEFKPNGEVASLLRLAFTGAGAPTTKWFE